jgi:glycosyltransferase involved in cell wall biosynthesis
LKSTPALYQSADVFLYLSKEEALGTLYLAAMACGVSVVAYVSSHMRWIVGDNLYLFESKDPPAIAILVHESGGTGASCEKLSLLRIHQQG